MPLLLVSNRMLSLAIEKEIRLTPGVRRFARGIPATSGKVGDVISHKYISELAGALNRRKNTVMLFGERRRGELRQGRAANPSSG